MRSSPPTLPGPPACKRAAVLVLCLLCSVAAGWAEEPSFTNFLAQAELAEQRGDVPAAMNFYAKAERLSSTNGANLCVVTRRYCDLMHLTSSPDLQKTLAGLALAVASRAVAADPNSAVAHLSLAVSYVKNFPYADNATKVKWSKAVKAECETGIALDPRQDVGYYLLGRWHVEVVNMNFLLKGIVKIAYGGLPKASNEEAIANFKKAGALMPKRIIHHLALAKVYGDTGQKKLAQTELETCVALKPNDRDDTAAQKEAAELLAKIRR
jgi:tetratricopeptide (TPR) repeat protein